jgi:hypothetical protein
MPVFRSLTRPIIRTAQDGADAIVWLGAAPEPLRCTGRIWHDRRMRPTHYLIGSGSAPDGRSQALWDYCEEQLARVGTRSG